MSPVPIEIISRPQQALSTVIRSHPRRSPPGSSSRRSTT